MTGHVSLALLGLMKPRVGPCSTPRTRLWSAEEDRILDRTRHLQPGQVADVLQGHGFTRGSEAIASRRGIRYGSRRPLTILEALEFGLDLLHPPATDWPKLEGTHEERDRAYWRLLCEEQLVMLRRAA
jgi:hypothetical protein